jgi:hypothetical protein
MSFEHGAGPARSSGDRRAARKAWTTPRMLRLEAGKAEVGSNPARPEGAFASGS